MKDQKYIFIDIDGTLFHQSVGIPQTAKSAIEIAHKHGHQLFICTGRPLQEVDETFRQLPFKGIIASSGSIIEIDNEILQVHTIDEADAKQMIASIEALQVSYKVDTPNFCFMDTFVFDNFKTMLLHELSYDEDEVLAYMERTGMVLLDQMTADDMKEITNITVFSDDVKSLEKIQTKYTEQYHIVKQVMPNLSLHTLEINQKDISKAHAIAYILDTYKANQKDTIAFGDSMNDVEMISYCAIGVAMGNAHEHVKSISNYITNDVCENGLANAFINLNLI
ncbi:MULTISPECIES: Cof-type HAD-IIB family hydrolase [unclassified Breznakia]|uniref:Cof-type HAD-IIB family hydrolase n=1 Tax=unclassified Breznakia TaxID=2623764 RepID=UPI0024767D49|nr:MULTISPECIES: Cof-type HAD-IIB family hydrolase [unclassified Breznakia]MDH6366092.1 Cof subfamily protein (haloacid dehalogenase superfamily) [Breznakia sp. PH1-1]MDH6402976.1 Cof subfamily protein (haloacid dehalogenase superfamily) [Breznakia sp. PF1-11]MDH6410685.1 Cof subfamily protein (haloacid dehalogenase superfamily) [Breznakia sp. PFB1-11]MDH6413258.1 Cof subfamily protein (haloacid dehalogenase superfamily) [Breznakia sp. PFB1-14]MDH6415626.1 Cof subfamily protein (haloacid dehal